MNNKIINSVIDFIDDSGNKLIDDFVLPFIQGGKDFILEDEQIKPLLILRKSFVQRKLSKFLNFIDKEPKKMIEFIKGLESNEKVLFIETINKVIDLDDEIQIYMMSYLTKKYKENGGYLNYYEKKLFYNINTLSEDDFHIFYCIYKYTVEKNENSRYTMKNIYIYTIEFDKQEILDISLNRFVNLGLLIKKIDYNREKDFTGDETIKTYENYIPTEYTEKLYHCLHILLKDFSCEEFLKKKESIYEKRGLRRL